jgi:N6-adenosine-specific RNA methylase IME4
MNGDFWGDDLFGTILLDPPWLERGGGKCKRGADRHYPLMGVDDIYRTVTRLRFAPAPNAHCYLWVTNNFLPDGLHLMSLLDFRYVTNLVWVKDRFGLGFYFRGQHELLLFGVRGETIKTRTNNTPTVIQSPRRRHSQKPDGVYDLIEANSQGPYLELFARTQRPGWTAWGNEVPVGAGCAPVPCS